MTTADNGKAGRKPLRVLFVEDSKRDADYLALLLKNAGFALTHERVDTAEDMEQALKNATWDLIVSGYMMPIFSAAKALELVRKMDPDIPFVIVSGAVGEEVAVELMRAGANDFISKTNLSRLVPGIERELREDRDRQERKRAEEEIRLLTHGLLAAREEEKSRVSAILHHDVGSIAVGLSAHLDAIEGDVRSGNTREALKRMKWIRKMVGRSVAHLKQMAVELRPPELDLLGLSAALRDHFAHVTDLRRVRVHFRQNLGPRRLPTDVATVVFRIVQEALTNAIKHGHAKKVDVRLWASKKELSITVSYDGTLVRAAPRGKPKSPHLGLHMMAEMAASVGGTFKTESTPGKPIAVRAILPLETPRLGGRSGK